MSWLGGTGNTTKLFQEIWKDLHQVNGHTAHDDALLGRITNRVRALAQDQGVDLEGVQ